MNTAKGILIRVVFGVLVFGTATACARFSPSLIEQGIVQTKIKESDAIRITQVTVYREDGMTVVRGDAAFPAWKPFKQFFDHVDIDVVAPEGTISEKRRSSLIRKRIPKKRGRRAFFISRLSFDPPRGTIVQVAYHRASRTHE